MGRTSYSLCNDKEMVTYEPKEVAKIFFDFFFRLNSLPDSLPVDAQSSSELLQDFLSSCALPRLPSEALDFLNAPVTIDEVDEILK